MLSVSINNRYSTGQKIRFAKNTYTILPSTVFSLGGMYLICSGLLMLPRVYWVFLPFGKWSEPEFLEDKFFESTNWRSKLLLLSDLFR